MGRANGEPRLPLTNPYAWPCPVCEAIVGQGCTNPKSGEWMVAPHDLRVACADGKHARGVARTVKGMTRDADLGLAIFWFLSFLATVLIVALMYGVATGSQPAQVAVAFLLMLLWSREHTRIAARVQQWYDEQVLDAVRRIRTHMQLNEHERNAVAEICGDESEKELK